MTQAHPSLKKEEVRSEMLHKQGKRGFVLQGYFERTHADIATSSAGVMDADIEQETYRVRKVSIADTLCSTKVA